MQYVYYDAKLKESSVDIESMIIKSTPMKVIQNEFCSTYIRIPLFEAKKSKQKSDNGKKSKPLLTARKFPRCHGFLIRDDLILTDSSCAKSVSFVQLSKTSNTTYHIAVYSPSGKSSSDSLPGVALMKLTGQKNDEFKQGLPRLRAILNNETIIGNGVGSKHRSENGIKIHLKCEDNLPPILSIVDEHGHNALSQLFQWDSILETELQEVMKSNQINSESIIMYNDENQGIWWTTKRSREYYYDTMIRDKRKYFQNGPSDSLNVWDAMNLGGLIEAIDPTNVGHRLAACHESYIHEWKYQIPFSGEDYFNWLDYGNGSHLNLTKCPRETLDGTHIHFFSSEDRLKSRIQISVLDKGKSVQLKWKHNGQIVGNGTYLFAWGLDKHIYLTNEFEKETHSKVHGHHSFFSSKPVLGAGMIRMKKKDGILKEISASSGHYKPGIFHINKLYQFFHNLGAKRDAVRWCRFPSFTENEWEKVFIIPDSNILQKQK